MKSFTVADDFSVPFFVADRIIAAIRRARHR